MQTIAALERQFGRVPSVREIATELGVKPSKVRSFISKNLLSDKIDGTSVFHASLREELLSDAAAQFRHFPDSSEALPADNVLVTGQHEQAVNLVAVKLHNGITAEDYEEKLATATQLLSEGNRLKISIELAEGDLENIGLIFDLINKFANDLGELAVWKVEPLVRDNVAYLWVSKATHSNTVSAPIAEL